MKTVSDVMSTGPFYDDIQIIRKMIGKRFLRFLFGFRKRAIEHKQSHTAETQM